MLELLQPLLGLSQLLQKLYAAFAGAVLASTKAVTACAKAVVAFAGAVFGVFG